MPAAQKHIVFNVLNWGLGHATRSIPIIKHLHAQGHRLTCCSSKEAFLLLQKALPFLDFVELPDYGVQYRWNNMAMNLAMQAPKLFRAIAEEQRILDQIHRNDPVDLVISDQRYGCYLEDVPSVFITHQISLKARKALTASMANKLHHLWIGRFDEVWIPDEVQPPGLAGKLSHDEMETPHFYLGPISRFQEAAKGKEDYTYDWLCLLSGPEPARTRLEELCIELSEKSDFNIVLVRGKVDDDSDDQVFENLRVIGHVQAMQLQDLMEDVEALICRSGYSSLMDLAVLDKKAVLIPTPGQPEQIYLANLWKDEYQWPVILQSELDEFPSKALLSSAKSIPLTGGHLMSEVIDKRLKSLLPD